MNEPERNIRVLQLPCLFADPSVSYLLPLLVLTLVVATLLASENLIGALPEPITHRDPGILERPRLPEPPVSRQAAAAGV